MDYKDYYKIMGVPKTADAEEIKKTYRKLAKQYHPDANPENRAAAEAKFKEISEAYEVLGDAQKRKKYDEMSEMMKHGGGGFDSSAFSGYASGGGNGGAYTYTWSGGGDEAFGFSDFFNQFFGGDESGFSFARRGGNRSRQTAGEDLEGEVTIGVKEAYSGTNRMVRIGKQVIDVKIPAGVTEGERIRVVGAGGQGSGGGANGNLYLRVKTEPEEGFSLHGLDVEKNVDLLPWEAALGCKKSVETLDGTVSVRMPPRIQAGKKIRLAGKGMKNRKGAQGDLYLCVRIVNPPVITAKMEELFRKLAEN